MASCKTTRITLDVDTTVHFELGAWLAAAYPIVGGRVHTAAVIRALIAELMLTSDDVARDRPEITRADKIFAETLRLRVLGRVKAARADEAN